MKDKVYEIALNPKFDGYLGGLASIMYNFFVKKIRSGTTSKVKSNVNEVLA